MDTSVRDVMPAYPNAEAEAKITIEQLLTHKSRLGDLWSRPGYAANKPNSRVGELAPAFWAEPVAFEPGSRAMYSNEGFVLLGAIIETVTGDGWYDQVNKHIFQPVGMTGSGHPTIEDVVANRALGYRYLDSDLLGIEGRRPNWARLGYRGNACGGGYSTLADMTAYIRALRDGRLASRAMTETLTSLRADSIPEYGMGFQHRQEHGQALRGHDGGGPNSGIDGDTRIIWESGWTYSLLGNYDAPFTRSLSQDVGRMLAAQQVSRTALAFSTTAKSTPRARPRPPTKRGLLRHQLQP